MGADRRIHQPGRSRPLSRRRAPSARSPSSRSESMSELRAKVFGMPVAKSPENPLDHERLRDLHGGVWKPVAPYSEKCLVCLLGDLRTPRLGGLARAWHLAKPGREVLENWIIEIPKPSYRQLWCFYRYARLRPDCGRVYPYLTNALRRAGGTPPDQALVEGLALGLLLPPNCLH
jgi:hypothetical protein